MELQFQSDTCRCMKALTRDVRNAELIQEVRLSDGMPDIGRVLASWGQVVLRSKEWQGNLVTVSGGIMVWILYAPEDGTPPRCLDTWMPFQLKWEVEQTGTGGPIRICPLLRFVDSRSLSARKMMVRAGVAALGEAFSPVQMQVFYPSELPGDIQLLKNTYPVRIPKEAGEKTFLLDEELQIPAGAVPPERLLAYTVAPQLQEKRMAGDKVILRGTGKIHLIYRCAEGKIYAVDMEIPISQFAQLENTYGADAQADIMMGTTSLELFQNEGSQLHLKCGLVAQYLITDRYLAEVTQDAYSPHRELELKTEILDLPSILEQRTELVQAQQKLPGIEADVVDAVFLPDFPRQSRREERIELDIPGQFQLLYYGPDGSLQGSTVRWESNMQIPSGADCSVSFQVQPYGAVQTASGAEELNLNAQLKLEMQTQAMTGIPTVTGLELGQPEEPASDRPSLILCRSGEQTLWDIAKQCGSTMEDIRRVNGLADLPETDRMLLIPVL